MQGAVTVHMDAPAMAVWSLVADVRNTGRSSPETFDAEWLDGVTEPAVVFGNATDDSATTK